MWRLGFFFHEMGFGLLSVFLPLYVVSEKVQGSLVHIGIMTGTALFLAIPASFFWGYLCDKTKKYKRYILFSFASSSIILYLFTMATSISLLIVLYTLLSVLHVAHEAPKNVLIAESYSRTDWERSFAFYEGFTETGWLIGLLLGFLLSIGGTSASNTLFVVSTLNLFAFAISIVLIADPTLVFERGLVSMEKSIDFVYHGVSLASRILDGQRVNERLKRENVTAFCIGLVLFSLATSILFTPMPIFISYIAEGASLSASFVFAVFVLNSGGAIVGYFLAGIRSFRAVGKPNVGRAVIFRGFLALLLVLALPATTYRIAIATGVLIMMGFVYALFLVYTLSLSMELIPAGKAGLFNVLIGVGGASGSYIGPFIAESFAFLWVFLSAGILFLVAYFAFKIFGLGH